MKNVDWVKVFKALQQAQDGFVQLEGLGVPRDRALAVIDADGTADLEISSVIKQLVDLVVVDDAGEQVR